MGYLKTNTFREIDSSTIAIQITNSIHGEVEALIDANDLEQVKKLYWNVALYDNNKLYVRASVRKWQNKGNKGFVSLHRYLLDFPEKPIDHINGIPLDNRRQNLRTVTCSENSLNRIWHNKQTGLKGVTLLHQGKYPKSFQARISVKGKRLSLGYFETAKDAAVAYNEAAIKYHGEFARLNDV